jgi:hypothetical protein
MWCAPVKFGGDSGAVRQVSDIGGGFERVSFTVRSRACHGIRVKREIIIGAASLRTKGGGESFVPARRFLDPRSGYISAPNAPLSHLGGACLTCRRTSAPPRVAFDSSGKRHRSAPFARRGPRQGFPSRERALGRRRGSVFSKKKGKYRRGAGGLHGSTETRNDVSCRGPTGGLRRAPVA